MYVCIHMMCACRYFCGHDHNLQHIKENSSQVNYFVAGAGHLTDPSEEHMVCVWGGGGGGGGRGEGDVFVCT